MVTLQFQEGVDMPPKPISQRKQLLVNIVDGLAAVKPQAAHGFFPVSPHSYEEGFRRISYKQFANMINGIAWWLTAQMGKSTSFETVTYVGPNDFVHNAMVLACAKAGYKLLLASPRNQQDAFTSLLRQVDCKAVLSEDPQSALTNMIQIAYPMPSYQVPNIETLLNETFAHYPYQKTFEDAKNDPLLVLHTSGTTSLPKPLTFTNDWTMAYMQALQLSSREGMELKEMYFSGNRFFVTMPPFHAAYLFTTFYIALLNETTIILPPSKTPPSVELFIEGIQRIEADAAFIQPSFVSQVAANPEYLDITTRRLDTLFTSGGKVFEPHGNIVSSRIRFLTVFGATEVGSLPDIIPSPSKPSHPDAWAYINPHPDAGWEFRLHTSNEVESIYEAWIVRSRNPEKEQPVFKLFPDCTEHSTRDLFVPHPKQPGLWKWHSRVDDTITLSTGANISPVIMENGLSEHPAIKGALMIGTGQLRPILLVELEDPPTVDANMGDILEQFWETVEQLNRHYYHDHRILKTHVLVARQERPMLRSQKGSIQRGFTADLYRPEIQDIYSRPAESHHVNGSSKMVGIAA